jgi:N-methylhydantoinase A
MDDVERAFYAAHARRYAHAVEDPVEIVSFRLSAYGVVAKPRLEGEGGSAAALADAITGERPVAFEGTFARTPVYARERLPVDAVLGGPALVEEAGTTTVVPPGFRAWADALGSLILERG